VNGTARCGADRLLTPFRALFPSFRYTAVQIRRRSVLPELAVHARSAAPRLTAKEPIDCSSRRRDSFHSTAFENEVGMQIPRHLASNNVRVATLIRTRPAVRGSIFGCRRHNRNQHNRQHV
jgi:hypothetical protein